MKAISIKQPWAWAIIYAGKDVENRTWHTNYRGGLLIHASKCFDDDGYEWMIEQALCNEKIRLKIDDIPLKAIFPRGGIIGRAILKKTIRHLDYSPWMFGPWGFVLQNAEPLPFYPCKGQLGIFDMEYPK